MDMFSMVGKRLRVRSTGGHDFGPGTYLWDDEILLDTGKKILASGCRWDIAPPSEVPSFELVLSNNVRVFEGEHNLRESGYCLRAGDKIRIEKIQVCGWNHGGYVAAKFFFDAEPYWLLMSEVELPKETPHLRLVS